MTLLAMLAERLESLYASVLGEARRIAAGLLAPAGPIPRAAVEALLRRALRNGAWRTLAREERALLLAAARAKVRVYRSPRLLDALRRIWLRVEEATARGRAVVAAVAHLLAKGASTLQGLLRRSLDTLLALGLQLLNHPMLQPAGSTPPP